MKLCCYGMLQNNSIDTYSGSYSAVLLEDLESFSQRFNLTILHKPANFTNSEASNVISKKYIAIFLFLLVIFFGSICITGYAGQIMQAIEMGKSPRSAVKLSCAN